MRIVVSIFIFFSLAACLQARGLRVAFVGDPQVDNETELGYARKSIYQDLKGRADIDLVVVLGDLVNDNPDLLSSSRQILDSLRCPWLAVPGNHDFDVSRDKGRIRDLVTWKQVIGYADTTFVVKNVRFALVNNVAYKERGGYEGEFNDMQIDWLDSLSKVTPSEMHFVLATHIPVSRTPQKTLLMEMFAGHKNVLLISGHTHTVARHWLEDNGKVEEVIAGAACGSWWRGQKDKDGVPYALQNCGAPRGYFVSDFGKKTYSHQYNAISEEDECSVYLDDKDGKSVLYVNVYGGHRDGKVEAKLPKYGWFNAFKSSETACEVKDVISFNNTLSRAERKKRKDEIIPLRRMKSPHLWALELPEGLFPDKVKIRYLDPYMSFSKKVQVKK